MSETDEQYLTRRIWDGRPLSALTEFPSYFEIETISACNAACPFCTISDWKRPAAVMKDDLYEKIVQEIGEHREQVKRVHLYRDGEPLMDKRLPRRIFQMKQAGIASVGISTNAALLNRGKASAIFMAGLDEIILSIDSLDKPVYESLRVGLDYATVIQNSINAFRVRDELDSKCRIRVRMIRQEANKQEWDSGDFQEPWKPYLKDGDTVEMRNIHNWGGQLDGFKGIVKADIERPCLALWSLCVIFSDGTVPLCNVDYNAKYPLGNVKDSTIAALWQGQEQNFRRQKHMEHDRGHFPPCANCTVWSEEARVA